ncbi:hypothetical protein AAG906_024738 [Vitis piasezkii]
MVTASTKEAQEGGESSYDRKSELKAFDDSKLGVKGLLDAGITKIPRIFINEQNKLDISSNNPHLSVPIIDLESFDKDAVVRAEIINQIRDACKKWGFFLVINHEIPESILSEMIDGIRRFHEQDGEAKKEWYTRDYSRKVTYSSNFDLYQASSTNWRDTFACTLAPDPPQPEQLPAVCRDILMEYSKHVRRLGFSLFELLSEALGLHPNHLKNMECAEGILLLGHYYPACPEPELTLGTSSHTDADFITILIQDQMGGLQVLHEDQWVNIPPISGALVINVGDLLQFVSNGNFKSSEHRVLAKNVGPRISVACFFRKIIPVENTTRLYGPIKELLSEDNPPIYRQENFPNEYLMHYNSKGLDGTSSLLRFKFPDCIRGVGLFQVVNHGIPSNVLEEMVNGIRVFNEQDPEVKKEYYSRDMMRKPWTSGTLLQSSGSWAMVLEATTEYIKHVMKLGDVLFELLSEALGLKPDHLRAMGYTEGSSTMVCHYYPACPEPELTMGASKHTDPATLTILLQDQIGGLQVFHENQWAEVHPIAGSLVINIGDFLQVMSNGKLKSVYHRVVANHVGPRISTAYFFSGARTEPAKLCGPLKELISEENPPVYRDFLVAEYIGKFMSKG